MPRILVIDDDKPFREMLRITLQKDGYEVDTAMNGNEGLKLLDDHSVDLVITDIVMPEKEGFETITELESKFPGINIFAISGGGRVGPESYLHLAEGLGAKRSFRKPLNMPELLNAINETLTIEG